MLLLDEPFSNLDAKLREQMRMELKLLQQRLNITVLFVTHDQVEALSLSDRIVLMKTVGAPGGRSPRALRAPANAFVRDFLGSTLLLRGVVTSVDADGPTVSLAEGSRCMVRGSTTPGTAHRAGDHVMVAVRPEDVEIVPPTSDMVPDQVVAAKALSALFLGTQMEYHVEVQGSSMVLRGDRHRAVEAGSPVWLKVWPTGHTIWPADL